MKNIKIVISILVLVIIIILKNKFLEKEIEVKNNIELNNNLGYITNREVLFINDSVFIGNNKKELENGYYDLKIQKINGGLRLNINKLVKEYSKDIFLDETYVIEIFNYLNSKFEYLLNKQQFINNIIPIYLNARKDFELYNKEVMTYLDNNINIKIYAQDYNVLVEVWR